MLPLGVGLLVAGVVALLVREIGAVRVDEPRGPWVGRTELLVAVALLLIAPRLVELLT